MIKEEEQRYLFPIAEEVMAELEDVFKNYEVAYVTKVKECKELRQRVGALMSEVAQLMKERDELSQQIAEQG